MVSVATARKLALSLPEAEAKSHFETPDFRVANKIFASLHEAKGLMMIKLTLTEQSVFCAYDPSVIYPVPGGWGRRGATFFNLKKVPRAMLLDALTVAWKGVAKPALIKKYYPE